MLLAGLTRVKMQAGIISLWASGHKTSSVLERMQKTSLLGSYSKGVSDTCCHELEVLV